MIAWRKSVHRSGTLARRCRFRVARFRDSLGPSSSLVCCFGVLRTRVPAGGSSARLYQVFSAEQVELTEALVFFVATAWPSRAYSTGADVIFKVGVVILSLILPYPHH